MKTIGKYIFLTLASVFVSYNAVMAAEPVKTKGVTTTKKVTGPVNNQYTLTLESFVEATVEESSVSTPVDVVLVLDLSGSMRYPIEGSTTTRLEALKSAVTKFIGVIEHNAEYEDDTKDKPRATPLKNYISIVKYAMGYKNDDEDNIEEGDDYYSTYNFGNHTNYTQVVKQLTLVGGENGKADDLLEALDDLNYGGATSSHYGMHLAERVLNSVKNDKDHKGHKRVVVMFTDGEPTASGDGRDMYSTAAATVNNAKVLKTDYDAVIYTVGVFGEMDSDMSNFVDGYMGHVSSNYPDASATYNTSWIGRETSISYSGQPLLGGEYYKKSSGANLDAIFESIAHGAAGAAVSLGTDVKVIDEVTSSFALPENAKEEDIKVYLVDCKSENTDGTLVFDELSSSNRVWPNNATYKPTLSPRDANGITHLEVKGFNFSENYCGRYYNEAGTSYTIGGKKLVIQIPIVIDQNAVGGLGVYTNTDQSGLYRPLKDEDGNYILDKDGNIQYENISSFAPKPTIDVPVNIQIRKAGLEKGESVVFNISRCAIMTTTDSDGNTRPQRDEDGNYVLSSAGYQPYTTMVVTGNDVSGYTNGVLDKDLDIEQLPISKISGLHPGYVYKIVESGWSWTYSNQESSITTGGSEQTTQGISVNPFVFDNKKTNTDVKNAEAVARNKFVSKTTSR